MLKRTFTLDVETCLGCGGRMRLLAHMAEPQSVARFLRHTGEPPSYLLELRRETLRTSPRTTETAASDYCARAALSLERLS